jgi:hypothetical protein
LAIPFIIGWFDPPLAHGYRFRSLGPASFKKIRNFPTGIDGDDSFEVSVNGASLGTFHVGQSVDFVESTGSPVAVFELTGIDPLSDASDGAAFPIELEFDVAAGEFVMEPLYISATATSRSAGANPNSLTCAAPVLGRPWLANVDLSTTGHPYAYLNGYLNPVQIQLPGGQVLLGKDRNVLRRLGFRVPLGRLHLGPVPGPVASFSLDLPLSASLVGTSLTVQALHFGGGLPFALSNAQDLVFGF